MSAPRIAAIDVLRGIAITAVVARHVSWRMLSPEAFASPGGNFLAAAHFASELGVPLFVAVSAMGMAWRYSEPFGGIGAYSGFVRARIERLIPAYVLWSLLSLAARDLSLLASPTAVFRSLLLGSADVQMYYVPMIFEFYLLWPLLRPALVRKSGFGALVVVLGGLATTVLAWKGLLPPVGTPLPFFATAIAVGAGLPMLVLNRPGGGPAVRSAKLLTSGRVLGVALLVVAMVALTDAVTAMLAWTPAPMSRAALYMVGISFAPQQTVYITSLTVALAVAAGTVAPTALGRVLATIGRASYGIFLCHLLVASTLVYRCVGVDGLANSGGTMVAVRFVAAWFVTLAISYALAVGLARSSSLRWMVGEFPESNGARVPRRSRQPWL